MCDTMPALSSDKGKHYDMEKHKRKLQKVNLSITVLTDDFELNVQNKQYKTEFKAVYDVYTKRIQCCEVNAT
jgi:hypothetical protein